MEALGAGVTGVCGESDGEPDSQLGVLATGMPLIRCGGVLYSDYVDAIEELAIRRREKLGRLPSRGDSDRTWLCWHRT